MAEIAVMAKNGFGWLEIAKNGRKCIFSNFFKSPLQRRGSRAGDKCKSFTLKRRGANGRASGGGAGPRAPNWNQGPFRGHFHAPFNGFARRGTHRKDAVCVCRRIITIYACSPKLTVLCKENLQKVPKIKIEKCRKLGFIT